MIKKLFTTIRDKVTAAISLDQLRQSTLFAPIVLWYDGLQPEHKRITHFSLVGFAVFMVIMLLSSGYGKLSDIQEEIEAKRQNLKELIRYEDIFRNQNALLRRLEREAKRKSADFSLLTSLESLAQNSNISRESIESISPKQLPPGNFFIETEATVKLVRVRLKSLIKYFYAVESSKFNLLLKEVRVKPRFDNPDTLNVTFKVSDFKPKE